MHGGRQTQTLQAPSVQLIPTIPWRCSCRQPLIGLIQGISEQGTPLLGEMNADLMGAACMDQHFQKISRLASLPQLH